MSTNNIYKIINFLEKNNIEFDLNEKIFNEGFETLIFKYKLQNIFLFPQIKLNRDISFGIKIPLSTNYDDNDLEIYNKFNLSTKYLKLFVRDEKLFLEYYTPINQSVLKIFHMLFADLEENYSILSLIIK